MPLYQCHDWHWRAPVFFKFTFGRLTWKMLLLGITVRNLSELWRCCSGNEWNALSSCYRDCGRISCSGCIIAPAQVFGSQEGKYTFSISCFPILLEGFSRLRLCRNDPCRMRQGLSRSRTLEPKFANRFFFFFFLRQRFRRKERIKKRHATEASHAVDWYAGLYKCCIVFLFLLSFPANTIFFFDDHGGFVHVGTA